MKTALLVLLFACVLAVSWRVYRKSRPLVLETGTEGPAALSAAERRAFRYAALAPNAHNAQVWRVEYGRDSGTFSLSLDEARKLPHTDPDDRESYLSLGAFLENLRQAGEACGLDVRITLPDQPGPAARVRLAPLTESPSAAAAARPALMEKRHTDKRPFEDRPLEPAVVESLLKRHGPSLVYFPKGTPEGEYLARNAVDAMRTQGADSLKRDELARWLRFSDQEAREKRDGLPAEQLGLRGLRKCFYYLLYNREKARSEQFAAEAVTQTKAQVQHCAGFFVLTGESAGAGAIRTGMALEAFWLDAVESGISLHPLSQMLEEAPYRQGIMRDLGLPRPPQMILRAGLNRCYGSNPGIRRRPADFISVGESPARPAP